MILVTGAAGKTGTAVIKALAAKNEQVRGLVRREEQAAEVTAVGAVEVVVGDMGDTAVYQQAAHGVRAIYHICPNMHPDEAAIGKTAIEAAKNNGVTQFVYHSVMHPQTEMMPHHWHKLRVEEIVMASDLNFTILQPAAYMQNILGSWQTIVEQGKYIVPYPVETKISIVDLADVAEVAACVLTEAGHEFAIYELAGPENLSQKEVAAILQTVLQQTILIEEISQDEWRKNAAGLGEYQVETLLKMFTWYAEHGFAGNSNILAWLLGRPPTTFAEFVASARIR